MAIKWPNYWVLLATRSKYVSEDSKKMKISIANKYKISKNLQTKFCCLKLTVTHAKINFIKIGAKKIM